MANGCVSEPAVSDGDMWWLSDEVKDGHLCFTLQWRLASFFDLNYLLQFNCYGFVLMNTKYKICVLPTQIKKRCEQSGMKFGAQLKFDQLVMNPIWILDPF